MWLQRCAACLGFNPNSRTELTKEQQDTKYKKYRTKNDYSLKQAIPNKPQIAVSIKRVEIAPRYFSMKEIRAPRLRN
jgi:hypothetical protein